MRIDIGNKEIEDDEPEGDRFEIIGDNMSPMEAWIYTSEHSEYL